MKIINNKYKDKFIPILLSLKQILYNGNVLKNYWKKNDKKVGGIDSYALNILLMNFLDDYNSNDISLGQIFIDFLIINSYLNKEKFYYKKIVYLNYDFPLEKIQEVKSLYETSQESLIILDPFDIKNNLPYILPCGHTLCDKCLSSLEFKESKIECPIDSRIYEITKEQIPKNEMLIEYMLSNKLGPRYSYQIREYNIPEANFYHIIRRNCCQKILRFFYKLIFVKIIFPILNIIFFPFKKLYHVLKKIMNVFYFIYLKVKEFLIKIINKIKGIRFPKLNFIFKFFDCGINSFFT